MAGETAAEADPFRWLQGSELGTLIRRFNWASTPLGPAERWPHSLRTAVSLMLNSRHPMWIGWGPDASFLYNDAYISVLGKAKHPWALGRPAAEVWAEIWDVCGPLAAKVFERGEASFVDDVRLFMLRGEVLEETFYSFSYSPILDESGRVAGLFCPSTETTAKVLNARRLATLSELASQALAQTSTPLACERAMRTLAKNADELPFALLYLVERDEAVLHHAVGMDDAPAGLCPPRVTLTTAQTGPAWPIADAIDARETRICPVPHPFMVPGPAGQAVREAILIPITASGQERPLGLLLAGVNPTQRLDDEYRTFFTLVAAQIGIGITNAQAYEAERNRAERLAELDRAKTLFFSNVSHELRTPLTLVLSPIEEALAGNPPDEQRAHLQMARRNAHRLLKLVNNLLDFSRLEAGRVQAVYEPVDLAQLTMELAGTFRSMIERAGLTLTVRCEPIRQPVYVDREMWEKVVFNLLSNAFKFTFEGQIQVLLHEHGGRVELVVADTGVGIAEEQIERLFERFYRVQSGRARSHEGSGIGLALVRELVRLHGGTVEVSSTVDVGSRFTVSLPAGGAALDRGAQPQPRRDGTATRVESFLEEVQGWAAPLPPAAADPATPPSATSQRILLADDNADMRDYVRSLLQRRYDLHCVADGLTAWQSIQASPPDLISSDVMMPALDGFELLQRVRADPRTRELPVVLLSARAGEEARIEGLQSGADDYLVKPFGGRELVARIDSQLKLASLRRAAREDAETLAEVAHSLLREVDVQTLLQKVTDAATRLSGARYGAFFYNAATQGELSYQLYALSGAPREAFEGFGHPRATPIFAPTLRGEGVIRCDDVTTDPRFGQMAPYHGHPPGHLPVRSYLAVPVSLRDGEVIGGLFFGHPDAGVFDARGERMVQSIAAQAASALEKARLHEVTRRAAEERERLLHSERAARATAERLSAIKDDFLSTLSHELRTPLNAIIGWAQVLSASGARPDDLSRGVDAIYRNARAQAQLIEDLLDMSRITAGKLRLDVQLLSPALIIDAATDALRLTAEAKSIRIERVIDPRAGPISGDPGRLQQVVWNLLSNAIKFTPKRGKIQILLRRIESHVELNVTDNGIGIEPDVLPLLFERFRQADASTTRRYGGLGLGLSIVKSLVELHGGTVSANSAGAGTGATFTVRLPLSALHGAAAGDAGDPTAEISPTGSMSRVDLSGLRVLVVDDDADARALIQRVLSECQAEVLCASSGEEALALLDSTAPDLLVSDIGMPGMDGYELLRRLRARSDARASLRAIALSAFARTEDRTRALLAGFQMHVAKPVEPAELIATVAAASGRAAPQRET